ncbi:hypothetical protein HDU86_008005 [Geranomyces michiganensis]|nr:hypothetical protein HDU86_008005 [Geranomyces michiganensis]
MHAPSPPPTVDPTATPTSFRQMVARKRDQVQAVAGAGSGTGSGAGLVKTRSVPSLAQASGRGASSELLLGRTLSNPQPPSLSKSKMRKSSVHASIGQVWTPDMHQKPALAGVREIPPHLPRALPSLGKGEPVKVTAKRPASAGKKGLKRGSAHDLALSHSTAGLQPVPVMSVHPVPLPIDKGRPGSGGRRFPSQSSLHQPSAEGTADDGDFDDLRDGAGSMASRSARTSVGSLASEMSVGSTTSRRKPSKMEDIKALRKPQKAAVKKRAFQPALELPRWNTSTRAILPLAKNRKTPQGESAITRSRSGEGLDGSTGSKRRTSDKKHSQPDMLPIGGETFLSEPDDDTQDLDYDDDDPDADDYQETKYPVTPYQFDAFIKICPSQDDLDSNASLYTGPPLYTTAGYSLPSVRTADLARALKRVCACYGVLGTRFYRNDLIVDADVEGLLDRREWTTISDAEVTEVVDTSTWDEGVTARSVCLHTREWIAARQGFEKTFTALVYDSGATRKGSHAGAWVVFVASMAVADEISLRLAAREVLSLYSGCASLRIQGAPDSAIDSLIDGYDAKEHYDFVAFAHEMEARPTRHALTYWKEQCIETVQEVVDPVEKADMVTQLTKLEREREPLKLQIAGLRKRKADLESDLTSAVAQRRLMEAQPDSAASGESSNSGTQSRVLSYQDPTTNELHLLSPETQATIVQTILGESLPPQSTTSSTLSHSIAPLLTKHEVPHAAQERILANTSTLDAFASLTDATVTALGVLPKDRRQIMALVEYVRNRIKECLMEEGKLKHGLERRIAKYQREVETASQQLRTTIEQLDANEDYALRITTLVNPPYVETKILGVVPPSDNNPAPDAIDADDLSQRWSFEPLTISPATTSNMRLFQTSYRASARVRRAQSNSSAGGGSGNGSPTTPTPTSAVPSTPGSAYSSTDDSNDSASLGTRGHTSRTSPLATALTAFAILLKHVAGTDKFLLGYTHSFRRNGLLVGPVTDTLPIKVDMSKKGTTFSSVFAHVARATSHAKRYGIACPSSRIEAALDIPKLRVAFEYVAYRDAEHYRAAGLGPADLFETASSSTTSGSGNVLDPGGHLPRPAWVDTEADPAILKLVLVETQTELVGGFVYRRNEFLPETIAKWGGKFAAILEGVDPTARQLSVASIISRFYSSLWQGNPGTSGASLLSQTSSLSLQPNTVPNNQKSIPEEGDEVEEHS